MSKQRKLIQKAKRLNKKERVYMNLCKDYDKDIDFIDDVKISFESLDVSAKTVNGEIFLNEKLMENPNNFKEILKYINHELTHNCQQEAGLVDEPVDKEDYLEDPNEQEAFQRQVEFMSDHYSPEKIQDYLENLLDHHDITDKTERRQKIRELTKKP